MADRWKDVPPAERSNASVYINELCDALEVPRPSHRGSGYEFELPISTIDAATGATVPRFADLFKRGHFLLEAKDEGRSDSPELLIRKAFGQVRNYAGWIGGEPPPYLLVLDVGKTLMVWDRWSGSYGDFHAAHRIHLPSLADRPGDIALLRDIWTNPAARDPRGRAVAVTRRIAGHLADLAASLEKRGHDPEVVARFLIRCVFTMFAEDVGLLKDAPFSAAVKVGLEEDDPSEFERIVSRLWAAMDVGAEFGARKFLRFNGHFFHDQTALPLRKADLLILSSAAHADWSEVEPSIMGTLLTRALDPVERHRLGAEYTPREFVERLVRPTVEEPIRARWTQVQTAAYQLRSRPGAARQQKQNDREALKSLRDFHGWLRSLRFLDPACGSGNFLYVTLSVVKQVELEVLRFIEELTGNPELAVEEVGPWQFYGIEVKAWAREIAELTLWIGYHQWWRRTHGHVQPPEPVLRDTGTLELRDAVLAWDEIVHVPDKDRSDPTPRVPHPVTGGLVPDPARKLPYFEYRNPRPAPWPAADFIVGNPPYMGGTRMREGFGDGYVDALRGSYSEMPEGADYVMYWWSRAADEVSNGRATRAGLITTNSITQSRNRSIIEHVLRRESAVIWAIADHPWVDEAGSAAVRVAMTVIGQDIGRATLVQVGGRGEVVGERFVSRLNADLSDSVNVPAAAAVPLRANGGISFPGFQVNGPGFIVDSQEASALLSMDPRHSDVIKAYRGARDLTQRSRGAFVIDFGSMSVEEARSYPVLYGLVVDRVKPARDANKDRGIRENWWRFHRIRQDLRDALSGLSRYIVTPETAKHRFFTFLDLSIAPDNMLTCFASEEAGHLGVLSCSIHVTWALAAGGRLGVGNDPRYNKGVCFAPFPFPAFTGAQWSAIASVAEALDQHRKDGLARDARITMTGMYNVLEKLRSGDSLTTKEREIHELAACGVLRDLHDELDTLVAGAYGWPWPMEREEILSRLVELHDERAREEAEGLIRWLRPDYQVPLFGGDRSKPQELALPERSTAATEAELPAWPTNILEQISELQALLDRGPVTVEQAVKAFSGARREHLARHLETLEMMGEVQRGDDGSYSRVRA